jgi:hypothetical protein
VCAAHIAEPSRPSRATGSSVLAVRDRWGQIGVSQTALQRRSRVSASPGRADKPSGLGRFLPVSDRPSSLLRSR